MKIGDFGMSRQLASSGTCSPSEGSHSTLERTLTPGTIGTAAYCSPEVLSPCQYARQPLEKPDQEAAHCHCSRLHLNNAALLLNHTDCSLMLTGPELQQAATPTLVCPMHACQWSSASSLLVRPGAGSAHPQGRNVCQRPSQVRCVQVSLLAQSS